MPGGSRLPRVYMADNDDVNMSLLLTHSSCFIEIQYAISIQQPEPAANETVLGKMILFSNKLLR